MTPIEELNQLIALLRKYDLPLDANLEAAINQKMADVGGETIESNLKASQVHTSVLLLYAHQF